MTEKLKGRLRLVRSRQHWMSMFRGAAFGLLIGSIIALIVASFRFGGFSVTPLPTVAIGIGGLVLGAFISFVIRPSWYTAARAIDGHYELKDRSATALQFTDQNKDTDFHKLQIMDAISHLQTIDEKAVTPFKVPKLVPYACCAFAAAIALFCIPLQQKAQATPVTSSDHIVEIADDLDQTMMEEIEELARKTEEKEELKDLVTKLDELLQEMKEPDIDEREALAKLSEMQAAVAEAQAEFNMEVVDMEMQSMGDAMASASALQGAANALQKGEYDKAAEDLETVDPDEISKREAKTVAKDLKKVAKSMGEAGLGKLSAATSEFTEGLEGGEGGKSKGAAEKLAKLARKFALRKAIGECLGCQLAKLGECKGQCKNGGKGKDKSDKPSNSWGRGSTGNPFGDEATRIDGQRKRETITGTPGEGPSEREITHAPEGRQNASREFRKNYKEFKKATEEVLRSEALPLGHRQTIRKYFESIRPDNETADETDETAKKTDAAL